MDIIRTFSCIALGLLCGCTNGATHGHEADTGISPLGSTETGGSDTDADAEPEPGAGPEASWPEASDDGADGGLKFDLNSIPDGGPVGLEYCDQINIVVVVDDSVSMSPYQDKLAAAMPAFIDSLSAYLHDIDEAHVLVTNTGRIRNNCQDECEHPDACVDISPPGEDLCEPKTYDACHDRLGAGVTRPVGPESSDKQCIPEAEGRFIDWFALPADQAAGRLACVMDLGAAGSNDEWPIGAVNEAILQSDPGFCNEGFRLEGAPWLIIVLTDEDDHTKDGQGALAQVPWLISDLQNLTGDPTLATIAAIGIFDLFPNNKQDPCAPAVNAFDKPIRLLDWFAAIENKACGDIDGDFELILSSSLAAVKSACLAAAN